MTLPANAELCDVDISVVSINGAGEEVAVTDMHYDDVFYLTLNDVVLATNHKNSLNHLDSNAVTIGDSLTGVQIYLYNWDNLVKKYFSNGSLYDYALGFDEGLTTFNWPESEVEVGPFNLDVDSEILIHAGSRSTSTTHSVRYAITGDDNKSIDCYHGAFQLNVKARYYIKQPAPTP